MVKKGISQLIAKRKPNSHKGDYGHVLILAGSTGLTGAAYLTSRGCLLSGSGLVTLGIAKSLNPIMEVKLSEVMTRPLAETKQASLGLAAFTQIKKILPRIDALAIGPGLSRNLQTQGLVRKLLFAGTKPLVLDADGINAKDFALKYKVVVALKGWRTVVADQKGQIYINKTGNPGMASAGCGDVLTGMIASFLGQGIRPYSAAKLAVYLHGLAGDYAAKEKGEISLTASDILERLPQAIKKIS
jgi:NAD(P)H-hydrate repair Nnr-like enzyme with NAD(P)H-hydrate dehydratase domain